MKLARVSSVPMQPQVPTMKSWYVSLCLLSLLWQYQDSHPLPLRLISRTRGRSIFYSLSAGIITNPEGEQPFGRSIQEIFTRNPNDSTINTPHNNHIQNTLNHPMLRRATQLTPETPNPSRLKELRNPSVQVGLLQTELACWRGAKRRNRTRRFPLLRRI